MRIAILSTNKLPSFLGENHPTEESLFAEDNALIAELAAIGVEAERIPWRNEGVDWSSFEAAVIRSTWDYIDSPDDFMSVLESIDTAGTRLINPLGTVRWNFDKRYLTELDRHGILIVPTFFLDGGAEELDDLRTWLEGRGKCVAKPTVGVGGFGVKTYERPEELLDWLSSAPPAETIMIQPFLPSIAEEGEWSFVFGCGEPLYSVLKKPKAGDFRVQVMYGATTLERTPAAQDLQAAEDVWNALPSNTCLARIDMSRLPDGRLALMEAELIEPQLFLFDVPDAARKLAGAIERMLIPT